MESLPQVKEMQAGGLDRGEGYRPPPAERTRRHRAQRATHPARLPDLEVLKSCARRAPEIDRAIPAGFVPGLSTRKVGAVLLALPGRPVPAATMSRIARTLDLSLAAFHRRPLEERLQGAEARRRGAGPQGVRRCAQGGPSWWRFGIRHDGTKESIDVQRERRPVGALPHRAAPPRVSEMIGVDGGQGLIAALTRP